MKYFFFIIVITLIGIFPQKIHAVTPTQTPSTTPTISPQKKSAIDEQINNLKDKIASKVATLKLVEKKGTIGTVTTITSTQITLSDVNNETRFVDVDEITKFVSASEKESFGISDITKGKTIGVFGLYNKQSRRILARYIEMISLPKTITGYITNADEENFTLTISTTDKKDYVVDIENTTKITQYTKKSGAEKLGFSKIEIGSFVIARGLETKEDSPLTGTRIIIMPEINNSEIKAQPTTATKTKLTVTPTPTP